MMKLKSFLFYQQYDLKDCGPTCLRMIAKHYGKNYTLQNLREKCAITNRGVSLLGISDAAEVIHFRTIAVKIDFEQLRKEAVLLAILHWKQNHFVVVYKVTKTKVYIADPGHGLLTYSKEEFLKYWISSENFEGIALLLEPMPEFFTDEGDKIDKLKLGYLIYPILFGTAKQNRIRVHK